MSDERRTKPSVSIRLLATTVPMSEWQVRGVCRGIDPEIFYPNTSMTAARRAIAAKRICYRCPVISECLTWALRQGEEWGIWGGLSEYERRKLLAGGVQPGASAAPAPSTPPHHAARP